MRTESKHKWETFLSYFSSFILGMALAWASQTSYALPQGGQVEAGQSTITANGNTVNIQQGTDKAIINWNSYNVGKNETVNYQQPNAGSISLNRISPNQGPSQIYGSINANGQVWLVNPAGIWIGPSAHIDVAGLVATTAGINSIDFMAGRYQFFHEAGYAGSIINEGTIKVAEAGLVALVGNGVVNNGYIEANLGTVVLGSGHQFTVNFTGNQLVSFAVDGEAAKSPVDQNGHPLSNAISNSGTIIANGGKIAMTATSAGQVLDNAINMEGVAQAKSVGVKNGEIILTGGEGIVQVSGKLIASGKNSGERGGKVIVTGQKILAKPDTVVDVSGDSGGGDIYIGGSYQGKGPLPNAQATVIAENTQLLADALNQGDGGNVIIWSDAVTKTYGTISVRGGANGGNGGFIETSSHDFLDIGNMHVDLLAPQGKSGTWLLDPRNVTIVAGSTSSGISNTNPFIPTADNAQLAITTLLAAFTGGATVIVTTGSTGAQSGSITLSTPLDYNGTGTNTLSLSAANGINLNSSITDSVAGGDTLNLILNADSNADEVGTLTIAGGETVNTNNGSVAVTAADVAINGTFNLGSTGDISFQSTSNTGLGAVTGQTFTMSGAELQNITARNFTLTGGINRSFRVDGISAANSGNISGTVTLSQNPSSTSNDIAFQGGASTFKTLTINSSSGVFFTTAGLTVTTGPLIIDANTNNDTSGNFDVSSPLVVSTSGATGSKNITIKAYDFVLGSTASLNAGTGTISITANGSIGLGATAGNMTITGTELQNITAGALTLTAGADSSITVNNITGTNSANISGLTTLDASNGTLGAITFATNASTFKTLTAQASNGITFNKGLTITTGALSLNANTDNNSTGTLTIATGNAVTTNTANTAMTLTARDIDVIGTLNSGTNNITITATDTLGVGNGSGNMSLSNTELANITTTNLSLKSGSNASINVDGLTTAALNNMSGTFTLDTSNGTLGAISFTGATSAFNKNVSLLSSGALTQSAAITNTSGKTVSMTTGTSDITLDNASNDFATALVTLANNVTLTDVNALILGASTINGTLNITAGGAITQSGALSVASTSNFNAGANTITLTNTSNNFTGAVGLTNSGNNNVALVNNMPLVLATSSLGSGTLALTSNGAITQTGALTQSSSAGAITLSVAAATSDITLSQANNLSGTVLFGGTTSNIEDFYLRNINASAAIPNFSALSNLRNLTLVFDNAAIALPATTLTSGGNLTLTSGGAITQSGAIVVPGTTTLNANANAITLNNANNVFTGAVSLSNSGSNNVNLNNNTALILGASTLGQNLTITAAGSISQTGALVVPGTSSFSAGANGIDLYINGSSNLFSGAVSFTNSGANDVLLFNNGATILGASTFGRDFTVSSGDAITQTGAITGSTLTATVSNDSGAAITLNNTSNDFSTIHLSSRMLTGGASAGALSYRDANSFDVSGLLTASTITLTAGGYISDSGNITGTTLTTATVGGVTLDAGVIVTGFNATNTGSGNVILTNNAALNITGITQNVGDLTIDNATDITQSGAISANGSGSVTTLSSGGGNILLTNAANDFNSVSVIITNNVNLTDTNALNIDGINATGNITLSAGGLLTDSDTIAGSTLTTSSVGGTTFDNGTIVNAFNATNSGSGHIVLTNSGALDITGISQGVGNLTITNTGAITQSGAINVTGVSSSASFAAGSGNNITLNNVNNDFTSASIVTGNNIILNDVNALVLGASTAAGTFTVTAGNTLTQSGAVTGTTLTAKTLNNSGAAISLTNSNNNFNTVNLAARNAADSANVAGAIAYTDTNGFDISGVGTTSTIALTSGGTITDSGAITGASLTTSSVGGTNLDSGVTVAAFNATNTGSGNIDLNNTGALDITGIVQTVGNLNIDNIGVITQSGPMTVNGVGATATFGAGSANNITLANTSNDFTTAAITSGNNVSLRDANALVLGASTVAGTLTLVAGNILSQSGALSGVTLSAKTLNNSGAAITLNNSNNNINTINLATRNAVDSTNVGGAITYNDINGFDVSGIATTSTIALTSGGAMTDSGAISGSSLTATSVGGIAFDTGLAVAAFTASNSGSGSIILNNTDNLSVGAVTQSGGGDVAITNTGTLNINGNMNTDGGNVTLATNTPDATARTLTINGDIDTNGGNINVTAQNPNNTTALVVNGDLITTPGSGGILTIGGGVALNAAPTVGLGNITLQGNGLDLTLGTLSFANSIDFAVDRFITVTGAVSTSSGANIALRGDNDNNGIGGVYVTSTGSLNSAGTLLLSGASLNGLTGADSSAGIQIDNGASVLAAGNIMLIGNTGNSNIDINAPLSTTSGNIAVTPAGTGWISLGANLTTQSGDINLNKLMILINDATINSGNGAINFADDVQGASTTLTLQNNTSASGTVTFNGDVILNNLITFAQPYQVVFNGSDNDFTNQITFNTTAPVTFGNGNDTFNFLGGLIHVGTTDMLNGSITTNNNSINLGGLLLTGNSSFTSYNGNIAINDTIMGPYNISFNAGTGLLTVSAIGDTNDVANSPNAVTLTAATINANGDMNLNGALQLNGNTTINAANINANGITVGRDSNDQLILGTNIAINSNNNAVLFNAKIDGANQLNLNSGSNDITFDGNVGSITPLTAINIANARNITGNSIINATDFTQTAGSGTTTFNAALTTSGTTNITNTIVNGALATAALRLAIDSGVMTGTVAGQTGANAIKLITFVNPVTKGTIYFDGIDVYSVLNPDNGGGVTPVIPTNPEAILTSVVVQYGNFYQQSDVTLVKQNYNLVKDYGDKPIKVIGSGNACVNIGEYISICVK